MADFKLLVHTTHHFLRCLIAQHAGKVSSKAWLTKFRYEFLVY